MTLPDTLTLTGPEATGQQMTTEVINVRDRIVAKTPLYTSLYAYYDGNQPLKYSTARLQEAFGDLDAYFAENWCAVVVDSALDRLSISGLSTKDSASTKALADLWDQLSLALESHDAHESAMVTHEAFVVAWKTEDGELEVFHNDPRICHVEYDPNDPKSKLYAGKVWSEGGYVRMVLYFPGRVEQWRSTNATTMDSNTRFMPYPDPQKYSNPHDFEIVPVFHFRTSRRGNVPDLTPATLSLQDAVNKLLSDTMVSAEFGAFRQRVFLTEADPSTLKNKAGENWWVPDKDGKVLELGGGSELPIFLQSIEHMAHAMAITSRTPKHYFVITGGDPSGDALHAMEAPLIKRVKKRRLQLASVWRELGAFLLKQSGYKDAKSSDVSVDWEPEGTEQPKTQAETRLITTQAGVPLPTALRWEGKPKSEIDQVMKEQEEVAKKKDKESALALQAIRDANASNNLDEKGDPIPADPNKPQKGVTPPALAATKLPSKG